MKKIASSFGAFFLFIAWLPATAPGEVAPSLDQTDLQFKVGSLWDSRVATYYNSLGCTGIADCPVLEEAIVGAMKIADIGLGMATPAPERTFADSVVQRCTTLTSDFFSTIACFAAMSDRYITANYTFNNNGFLVGNSMVSYCKTYAKFMTYFINRCYGSTGPDAMGCKNISFDGNTFEYTQGFLTFAFGGASYAGMFGKNGGHVAVKFSIKTRKGGWSTFYIDAGHDAHNGNPLVFYPKEWPSDNQRIYFFSGSEYTRYGTLPDGPSVGYPKDIATYWHNPDSVPLPNPIKFTSALDIGNGSLYLFSGSNYYRYDKSADKFDKVTEGGSSYPRPIDDSTWPGLKAAGFVPFDQAIYWGNQKAYFFKTVPDPNNLLEGKQLYVRFNTSTNTVDNGPLVVDGNWGNWPSGFNPNAAAIDWGNGKVYLFSQFANSNPTICNQWYLRYDKAADSVDKVTPSYPWSVWGYWYGVPASIDTGVNFDAN